MLMLGLTLLTVCALLLPGRAYVPAIPTNDTTVSGAPDATDSSMLISWYSEGSYATSVSHTLIPSGSSGYTEGALVHFDEDMVAEGNTTTPWIALVSCDGNATNPSETDIFTLASQRGAVAAILWSNYSVACAIRIDAAYVAPLDVFSTHSLTSGRNLDNTFLRADRLHWQYSSYDGDQLTKAASAVQAGIQDPESVQPGYIIASLYADVPTNSKVWTSTTGLSSSTSGGAAATATAANGNSASSGTSTAHSTRFTLKYSCIAALLSIVAASV
ncbi:hypothetical protein PUNSTDRAFT_125055 [Punctularia strigosozonata HHB-11173 SS5]|uniref:uncharacterized protein n=1 Tax=Punctularia strigosozonata (strain HHB-11173) TaxID=741275 RepID=UPI000441802D|nr:uncharacterized protein PUNSTDRAFT_125055 [Punctularia strigosozonata HHB-11173 SS5]EIN11932.1 hypothetical protein PUNSTDRAFT_125055 [Punctularia strigosozonata HHB-11173 SS5]